MATQLRLVRSFLVDLVLAATAAALRLHPVYGFFQAHPEVAYWGVGVAHLAIAPFLVMHCLTGGRQARDLVQARQGRIHGLAYRASFVGALTTSFFVPFLCAREPRRGRVPLLERGLPRRAARARIGHRESPARPTHRRSATRAVVTSAGTSDAPRNWRARTMALGSSALMNTCERARVAGRAD